MLRPLIVDDEPIARGRLRALCARLPEVVVVGEAATGAQALMQLEGVDLVLLDIAMPDGDGLSVAAALARLPAPPAVVFCTAHPDHALEAFDVAAVDYLLKPVGRERLARAVDKTRKLRTAPEPPSEAPSDRLDHLWAPHRDAMVRVDVADIVRVEAEGDYARIRTEAASYLIHETMARLEARLDPAVFVRVRRSLIVRESGIAKVRHAGDGVWEATLLDGAVVRVGPTYWKALKLRLDTGKLA